MHYEVFTTIVWIYHSINETKFYIVHYFKDNNVYLRQLYTTEKAVIFLLSFTRI